MKPDPIADKYWHGGEYRKYLVHRYPRMDFDPAEVLEIVTTLERARDEFMHRAHAAEERLIELEATQ